MGVKQGTGLIAETEQEDAVIRSNYFQEAVDWGQRRRGHPEATIGKHISDIFEYIDSHRSLHCARAELRITALLHDLGKPCMTPDKRDHATLSYDIAKEFASDEGVLEVVKYHDAYYRFYRKYKRGRFESEEFREHFERLDLKRLIRFMYCDSNNQRSVDSIEWFKQQCIEKGLSQPAPFYVKLMSGRECNLDGIKRIVKAGVLEMLVNPLYSSFGVAAARDYMPQLLAELKYIEDECGLQNSFPDESARKFISNLHVLSDKVNEIGRLKCTNSKFEMIALTTAVDFLTPICDYSNKEDPDCPDCPNRKPGVNQKSWLEKISPQTYIRALGDSFCIELKGVKVPHNLIDENY